MKERKQVTSSKQRRGTIKDARAAKQALRAERAAADTVGPRPEGSLAVDLTALAPFNSYGAPEFMTRGFYVDTPFRCGACGVTEVWTARQQKWWYEVAKGYPYSGATRCRACRHRARGKVAAQKKLQVALELVDSPERRGVASAEVLANIAELYVEMDRPDLGIEWLRQARNKAESEATRELFEARLAALERMRR